MTADLLTARSPLAGWSLRADGVTARELPFLGQLTVRMSSDPVPLVRGSDDRILRALRLGPDEWLVLTAPDARASVETELRAHGSVTNVSAQRTTIELTGARARDLLARGCAIDLDLSVAPVGTCVQTLLAQTGVTVLVEDAALLVLVRASFASYLARWLEDASIDLM